MSLAGKKLGLLLSAPPGHAGFLHALRLAQSALDHGLQVYVYCIDQAVCGVPDDRLQSLRLKGLKLFACALAAEKHSIPISDLATFSGLGALSDIITATDRFLSFNAPQ